MCRVACGNDSVVRERFSSRSFETRWRAALAGLSRLARDLRPSGEAHWAAEGWDGCVGQRDHQTNISGLLGLRRGLV